MYKLKSSTGAAVIVVAMVAIIASALTLSYYFDPFQSSPITGATITEPTGQKEIVVNGVGVLHVDPDQAVISFGVQTQAKTATQAIEDNAAKMSQVIDMLKAQGISDDDIKTSRFSLWTVYNEDRTAPIGYRVSNQVTVTTMDIDHVGQLIDSAVLAGANQIHSVSFSLSEETIAEIRFQALDRAIEDAEAKAVAIAKKLDLTIVGVGHVSESSGYAIPYYVEAASLDYREASTPIEPGEVSFTMTVNIVFLFEN